MIKQSSLLKWTLNNKSTTKGGNRKWIHPPEALQGGHVAYLVKFLGKTDAHEAKGIDVVKDGIHKLKFNHQLKRSEGSKMPKVELTVSVDGVAIQDPKTKQISYQYPLHRISYCADDKSDKKFFSFIAKEPNSEIHSCFVFVSDKLAEEITLTIGQAFDLAYRRFLETSGRELEMKRRIMILQKRVQDLEGENARLQKRLGELKHAKQTCDNKSNSIQNNGNTNGFALNSKKTNGICPPAIQPPPPVQHRHSEGRPRNHSPSQNLCDFSETPKVKRKIDNDIIEEFDPRANGNSLNSVNNNYISPANGHVDLFGCDPFNPVPPQPGEDPFGMGDFGSADLRGQDLDKAIGAIDRKLLEMRDGFQRGLSFGNDDFSTEGLETLNK